MKTKTIKSGKVTRMAVMLGSASLVLGATSVLAQNAGMSAPAPGLRQGFYVGADAGGNLLSVTHSSGTTFDPGLRVDLDLGYAIKVCDHFTLAPELEGGYLYNTWSAAGASGHVTQVPGLGKIVANFEFAPNWVVYVGGGAGCAYVDASGANLHETDFAWQGEAGIRYAFGSSDIGVGYKYLGFDTAHGNARFDNNSIMASYTFHF